MPELEPEKKKVYDLMRQKYEIPPLQREYDWKPANADKLLSDLISFSSNFETRSFYFMGSMIVYRENDSDVGYQVVDGQQRLASICLMTCAIRDFLHETLRRNGGDAGVFPDPRRPANNITLHSLIGRLDQSIRDQEDSEWLFIRLKDSDNSRLRVLSQSIDVRRMNVRADDRQYEVGWNENTNRYQLGKRPNGWINRDRGIQRWRNIRPLMGRGKEPRIYSVYDTFFESLREEFEVDMNENLSETGGRIAQLFHHIQYHVYFIKTEVQNLLSAFQIFETINTTGTKLTMLDVIRATLLGKAHGKANETEIQNAVSRIADDEILSREELQHFTRIFWISRNGVKRSNAKVQSEVIQYINDIGDDGERLLQFAHELHDNCLRYRNIIRPQEQENSPYSVRHQNDLTRLNSVISSHLSLLLKLRGEDWFTPENEVSLLRWFEAAWLMHNHTIGGRFHLMDQVYAKLCLLRVGSGAMENGAQITDFESLRQEILRVYDRILFLNPAGNRGSYTADMFEEDFTNLKVHDNKASNVILCQISNHIQGVARELQERSEVHVEHILPQNPAGGGWWFHDDRFSLEEESDYYYKKYVPRIGNLTLLHAQLNGTARNSPYDEKIEIFNASELEITRSLPDTYETWDADAIELRSQQLAGIALQIWTLISDIEEYRSHRTTPQSDS